MMVKRTRKEEEEVEEEEEYSPRYKLRRTLTCNYFFYFLSSSFVSRQLLQVHCNRPRPFRNIFLKK
jgi:hypothetical protein